MDVRTVFTILTVVVLTYLITDVTGNDVIYRNGCFQATEFTTVYNTTLPHNAPGTCLAYCKRQGRSEMYIALQDKSCSCVSHTSNISSSGCNSTCPGHEAHFCGNPLSRACSVYRIDYNNTLAKRYQCATHGCCTKDDASKNILYDECSNTNNNLFCMEDVNGAGDCSIKYKSDAAYNGSWEDTQNKCMNASDSQQYTSPHTCNTNICSFCVNSPLVPTKVTFWIGGFEQWAPRKQCTPYAIDLLGYRGGVVLDENTVFINCSGVPSTLYCLANGTWSGILPTCPQISTTRSPSTKNSSPSYSVVSTTRSPSTKNIPPSYSVANRAPSTTELPTGDSNSFPLWAIILCALLGVLCIGLIMCVVVYKKKKKQPQIAPDQNRKPEEPNSLSSRIRNDDNITRTLTKDGKLDQSTITMNRSDNVEKAFETEISYSETGETFMNFPPLNNHFLSQNPSQSAETLDQKAVMNKQLADSLIPDMSEEEPAGSVATILNQNKITSINDEEDTKKQINKKTSQQRGAEVNKGYVSMNQGEEMKIHMDLSKHDTIEGDNAKTHDSVATVNNLCLSENNAEQTDDAERHRLRKERKRKKKEKREKKMKKREQRPIGQDGMTDETRTETDYEIDKLLY